MNTTSGTHYRWCIFALCAAMFVLSQFWRVSTAVLAGELSIDLGLSAENLGLLGGAFFYSFCLAQLPMGPMLDRFGGRVVMGLLALIGGGSAIAFACSGTVVLSIIARIGIGIGMSAALMGSYKIFTAWYHPHEFATVSGVLIAIGFIGAIGATTPLAWLSDLFGWRRILLWIAVLTLLLATAFFLIVRDSPSAHPHLQQNSRPAGASILSGLRSIFSSTRFWLMAPIGFASYATLITVQGLWGGPYLAHTYGLSKAAASRVLLAIPIGIICGAPFWGGWSDRLQKRKMPVILGQGVMLLVYSSLALDLRQLSHWGLYLQFWLLGFTAASNYILYVQVKETFPFAISGTAVTALNFFTMLGAAVFQHMMGMVISIWSHSITSSIPLEAYRWGFGVTAALLALSLGVYLGSHDAAPGSALPGSILPESKEV